MGRPPGSPSLRAWPPARDAALSLPLLFPERGRMGSTRQRAHTFPLHPSLAQHSFLPLSESQPGLGILTEGSVAVQSEMEESRAAVPRWPPGLMAPGSPWDRGRLC